MRRPRPVMVKFVRSADVARLLCNRSSLSSSFTIRADLSKEASFKKSVLMKERWALIESGINRKSIKVTSSSIFVHDKLHGKLDSNNIIQLVDCVNGPNEVPTNPSVNATPINAHSLPTNSSLSSILTPDLTTAISQS